MKLFESLDSFNLNRTSNVATYELAKKRIEDLFRSPVWKGNVPVEIVNNALINKNWINLYGEYNLHLAFNTMVDCGYIIDNGLGYYIWNR